MNLLRSFVMCVLMAMMLSAAPYNHAAVVDLPVYKGELRFIVQEAQIRNNLTIRYRSKTREILRIAIDDLTLTNMATKEVIELQNQSAALVNRIDHQGYWNTDILYGGLKLAQDDYRIQGRLTLYLSGSQRSSRFSAYLKSGPAGRPEDSSIDWGLTDQ